MLSAAPILSAVPSSVGKDTAATRMRDLVAALGLPAEISLAKAAEILGVDKHTVLKYLEAGWLAYRDVSVILSGSMAPPHWLRPGSNPYA